MLKKKIVTVFLFIVMIFSLNLTSSAAYIGDVNGDGNITASDARTILRASAQLEQLSDDVAAYADVNSDNKITASDARAVLRMSAKLENIIEITTIAPETTTMAPETTTMAPETTTMAPETTTLAPETTTLAPETTTLAPETTTLAPETTTLASETTTLAPETTTMAPETTTMAPETTTMAPETTTLAPETTTLAPETTTLASETTTLAPETTTMAPETTTMAPETTTMAPETTTVPPSSLSSIEIHDIASKYTVEVNAYNDKYISTGSGFFISADGKVVTNYHVIDGMYEITVTDYNDTEYEVTNVLAYDEDMDIAVLKVTANANTAVLDYSTPLTGAVVYTLGSSKGMTDTFSNGIISNGSRVVEEYNPDMTYIQTTAPISNGNSGGPLINDKAEVIGINTWGITDGQNLNFAIPVKYINELDYSNPLTMEEFGAMFAPVTPTPSYPSSNLSLSADTTVRYLDKGGTAMISVEIIGDIGSNDIVVNYDSNTFRCEWDDNWYVSTKTGNTVAVVYVSALRYTSTKYIRVYVEGYKDSIYVDIPINVSSSGWYDYGGCIGAPDYGTYTGVAPYHYWMSEDADYAEFTYDLYELFDAGLDADAILTDFFTYIEYYGYTLVDYKDDSISSSYTYYNSKYDILYSYSLLKDSYGDYHSVSIFFETKK